MLIYVRKLINYKRNIIAASYGFEAMCINLKIDNLTTIMGSIVDFPIAIRNQLILLYILHSLY